MEVLHVRIMQSLQQALSCLVVMGRTHVFIELLL